MRITSNQPPAGNYGPVGETAGSVDNNPTFIKLVDEVWLATQLCQGKKPPANADIETVMKAVHALNTFLIANPPTLALNPQAYHMLEQLNVAVDLGGDTVASVCNQMTAEAVGLFSSAYLQGNDPFKGIFGQCQTIGSSRSDNTNATVKQDISNLLSDVKLYNWALQEDPPADPNILTDLLNRIKNAIVQFNADSQNCTDGYILMIRDFISSPLNPADSTSSLLVICQKQTFKPEDLMTALAKLNEASGNNGGDFRWILENGYNWEYKH